MNSGPSGAPGGAASIVAAAAAPDPSQSANITIMNITVPPVPVPVPSGLRFVHPYLPSPQQTSVSASQQIVTASSSGPTMASSPQHHQQQMQRAAGHQPSSSPVHVSALRGPYSRDVYRNASPNVSEHMSNVTNSPVLNIGVNNFITCSRIDRPRISLLPAANSAPTSASPNNPDYRSAGTPRGHHHIQQQPDYRQAPSDMTAMQDNPPFKKIRLVTPNQQQLPSSQHSVAQQTQQVAPVDSVDSKHKNIQQPLRIDTRPPAGAYTPQTEAISPTLPEPSTQEDAQFKSTKDDLLQQIAKVDREIAKRESQISKLRKKLKELEEVANKPIEAANNKRPVEETQQPKHQSLVQKIYAENRKKAEEAHRLLEKLGPKIKLPLYNQPSDTSIYHENRKRHQCMKAKLVAKMRKEHADRATLHQQQSETYAILVQEWHRKVEKLEATQKRKTKEARNREFFEKVFPELRKQREDKERFNRVGARIKSEADLEEIMDGLQEQEMEDKKMRSYAVIPPLLLDVKQRRIAYQNNNGLLQPEELEALHSERKLINVWSSMEHELFKEKYLQHPKNFGAIAQNFEHKSVADCVHHYYLTKKTENYKQLLRKSRRTRSSRNNPNSKVNNSSSTIGPMDILTTGVTTRLQREQLQKTQENPPTTTATTSNASSSLTATTTTSSCGTAASNSTATNVATSISSANRVITSNTSVSNSSNNSSSVVSDASTTISATTAATTTTTSQTCNAATSTSVSSSSTSSTSTISSVQTNNSSNNNNSDPLCGITLLALATTTANVKDTIKDNNKAENKESLLANEVKEETQSGSEIFSNKDVKNENKGTLSSSSSTSLANTQSEKDKKKCPGIASNSNITNRSKDKKKDQNPTAMETSDEENHSIDTMEIGVGRQIGSHNCVVCQNVVEAGGHSRPLSRSQASQYSLKEDQVPPGARVCNNCRCKSVRGRYTSCPLPGCPNLSGQSGKNRVKRLRALPAKWLELPPEIREPIAQEFQIPSNAVKCCSACFNRISRRLAPHLSAGGESVDDPDSLARLWSDEEIEKLRSALREHGTNWSKVSEQITGKSNHQCKNYYLVYRKKLALDQVVAEYYQSLGVERRPCLTDEEESGSSTSSCDESAMHDTSDTASAGSPANPISSSTPSSSATAVPTGGHPISFPPGPDAKISEKPSDVVVVSLVPPSPLNSSQTPANPCSSREDYDSSATETADEGQGSTDLENTSVVVTVTGPNSSQQAQQPPVAQSPPSTTSNSNPLTVKDLMLGVIEMQLKRNPNSPGSGNSSVPVSSGTPTISSILKTDHRNDISFVREYNKQLSTTVPGSGNNNSGININVSSGPSSVVNREPILATLSVVSGSHHSHHSTPSPQQLGQMQATITPCPPPHQQQAQPQHQPGQDSLPKEGLVVMQAQQAHRETEGTLDLSIKKPRSQQDYNHTSIQVPKTSNVQSHYRSEPPHPPSTYYHGHPHVTEHQRTAKSPHIYSSSPRPPAPLTPKLTKVPVSAPLSHPKVTSKLSGVGTPIKAGSITHGTPVSAARYNEGLLRQMTPPGNTSSQNPPVQSPVSSKETGSITQGTPVCPYSVDKRTPLYDYHRSIRHSPVTTSMPVQPSQNSGVVVSHGQSSQYNSVQYQSRRPIQDTRYTMEQLSSRQIIMNDYITSQQMHARSRSVSSGDSVTKTESPSSLYCASTPTPPPPPTHTQPRQGVIQRHNTQKHYAPPPPGLEAFSSLVDVAVQQPSLPVPHPAGSGSHPPPGSSAAAHEGLSMSYERLYSDRYAIDSRTMQGLPRGMSRQQAQYQMAVAMQERERDIMIREKEEEQQRMQQREKEIREQQQQEQHRMQREKEQQEQREKDIAESHRMQHEKDMQQQHYRILQQQREKEMQIAAQAQRDREIMQQREKEKEMQQQKEFNRIAQQKREKEHADRIASVQRERDLAYLQQQRYQKQMHHHQRVEAERRHVVHVYKDQDSQIYSERQCDSPSISNAGGFYQPSRIQQPPSQPSRHSQSSSNQQNEPSTLTAASLIDAIITHQINQSTENNSGVPTSNNQPTRPGDRLFQGFHRDSPAEPNGVAHSPAAEESNANSSANTGNNSGSKIITIGDHVEHIVNKDYGSHVSSYRSYPSYQIPEDQWKRRKGSDADSVKSNDERQIIRVAQQKSSPQQPKIQQSIKPFHTEPVSPPEVTSNHYARRFYDSTSVTTSTGPPSNKSHISPLDYVKNKIAEVMRTSEDDKGSADRNGSSGDKDDKRSDSSPSGEMVIDEGAGNQQQPPPPAVSAPTFYPFSALGVHTGPVPAPPPSNSSNISVVKSEQMQMEPAPLLSAQYEPLSDED